MNRQTQPQAGPESPAVPGVVAASGSGPVRVEAALLVQRLWRGDTPPLADMERVVEALYFGGPR